MRAQEENRRLKKKRKALSPFFFKTGEKRTRPPIRVERSGTLGWNSHIP
jgi:hypothetical protein